MASKHPPAPELIARAAELRAAGSSWEAVALQVGRAAETVRRWPAIYPGPWKKAFQTAERQLLAEATAEAVLTLRKHLRSDDEKISRDAAQRLIQFRVAQERRTRTGSRRPKPSRPLGDLQRIAAYLETLTDAERNRLLDELLAEATAERTLPGGTETAPGADLR